jgi:hypothetical protein
VQYIDVLNNFGIKEVGKLEIEGNREGSEDNVGWLEREGTKEGDDDGMIMVKVFTSFPLKNPPSPINLPPTLTS